MRKRWVCRPLNKKLQAQLVTSLRVSPLLAQLLINRGIQDVTSAHSFLQPKLSCLSDPMLMPDMEKAVRRLALAIRNGEKIFIYGDYDVDGVTGTALLLQCLDILGANVHYYIPERLEEGYGLNLEAIEKLHRQGAKVIVTVDCGISGLRPAEKALEKGIDLIVTDHHEPSRELPRAFAIINPRLGGYPFKELSGAGVAFKLAWAMGICLRQMGDKRRVDSRYREFLLNAVGLAAMGTIADAVPLVGENRILARHGLSSLRHSLHPGIKALLEVADLTGATLDPEHVGFRLGPRLNAAGRLENARTSVELLITQDPERAREIAAQLEVKNKKRQQLQAEILATAMEKIEKEIDLSITRVIVLSSFSWHPGVIGIVASRLAEEFHRPVVMIALRGQVGYGSARSIPTFHLPGVLEAAKEKLLSFGGHSQAAGLRIKPEEVEGFKVLINQAASSILKQEDLVPVLHTDGELTLERLSIPQVKELEHLCPYGEGNPEPLFMTKDLQVAGEPCRLGLSGQHLSLYLRQGDVSFRAIGFGMGEILPRLGKSTDCLSVAFIPKISRWRHETVELEIQDIQVD